jgi:flagellar basal-body rod modification protein FlgD
MLNLLNSSTPSPSAKSAAATAALSKVPSSIKTTTAANAEKEAAAAKNTGMGQKDFLTLFTTQLKNQDPLDPVKNEAFVAQLAQFSQLEATTGMAQTLTDFVSSMSGERMMSSANLIGKKVSVPDGPVELVGGTPIQGVINLPTGADGVKFEVFNDKGALVATNILGPQTVGDMTLSWNGTDDTGTTLPDGTYRFKATAASQGKTTNPSVSTLATVTGISQTADKAMLLNVTGGRTINLADVSRIGG